MTLDETPLETDINATQPGWTACLAMLIAWLVDLFDQITKLKSVRRTTKFKPTWRDHWERLRQTEWLRDQTLAFGAAELLAGNPLTLAFEPILEPPADYGGPCPRTPFEMNRRFLAIAQWLKDPEALIRRRVARIAKRAGLDLSHPLAAHGSTDAVLRTAAHHEAVGAATISGACVALMVSSTRSVRPSNHEGGLANARGPPHPPTPNSQLPTAHSPLPRWPRQRDRDRLRALLNRTIHPPMTTSTVLIRLKWQAAKRLAPARRS